MIQDELFKDFYSIPEGSETIVCSKCNRRLPRSSFSPESGAKYLKTVCKSCMSEYVRLLKHLRETTPPPPDDYVCPICNKNTYCNSIDYIADTTSPNGVNCFNVFKDVFINSGYDTDHMNNCTCSDCEEEEITNE